MLSLGTLFWKREPLLEHRQAQMNMSSALGDVLERPQQHGSRCLWDRPICLCTLSTLASCNARMNPVPSESSQAELLIGRVFLEISSQQGHFILSQKSIPRLKGPPQGYPLVRFQLSATSTMTKLLFDSMEKGNEVR